MASTTGMRTQGAGRGRSRTVTVQRWGALIGGGALAIYGITRRSPLGVALAAGGGTLALLGTNQRSQNRKPSTSTTILIGVSPREAYQFWRDFNNLPRFMNRLERVTVLDNRRSRWTAIGPMGRRISWETEITGERENEYIAWRSLPNSEIQVDGRVEFEEAPQGRGTFVRVRLEFTPALGMSSTLANFLSKGADFAVRQDMRRLEALLETGEIPTIEGQSHGPRDFVTGVARLADPSRSIPRGENFGQVYAERRRGA